MFKIFATKKMFYFTALSAVPIHFIAIFSNFLLNISYC